MALRFGWVRTSGTVGRITIESIQEGSIVVNDGTKSYEMTPDSAPAAVVAAASPIAGRPPMSSKGMGVSRSGTAGATGRSPVSAAARAAAARTPRTAPTVSPEQAAKMEALVTQLKSMNRTMNTEKSGQTPGDRKAMMERMMSGAAAAASVNKDEAEELGDLGKKLNGSSSSVPVRPPVSRPPRR